MTERGGASPIPRIAYIPALDPLFSASLPDPIICNFGLTGSRMGGIHFAKKMTKKNKPKNSNASLQERIDTQIRIVRNRRNGSDRDRESLKNARIMLFGGYTMLAFGLVMLSTVIYRNIADGNPLQIGDLLFPFVWLSCVIGFILLIKKVFFVNPEGQVAQGNALSKWTRLARISRGSVLRYRLGEKLSKLWQHGTPIAIVVCTIMFSFGGLGLIMSGWRGFFNNQNPAGFLGATFATLFGLYFLVILVLALRFKWNELKPEPKQKSMMRFPPKTIVETEQHPLIIGEESHFFIRQYCRKIDEFFGHNVDISLVLVEEAEYFGHQGRTELLETRQRAERFIYEHRFDNKSESTRYELSFTALLSAEDYVPTTRARFLSARLHYEWYLRVRIYSGSGTGSGTILSRDFPVVLSYNSKNCPK